jgi:predicted PurR-regulated permease PerM
MPNAKTEASPAEDARRKPSIHVEEPGPNEMRDPVARQELRRAGIWVGMVVGVILVWQLAQPLLLIMGGVVFAAMLDGGARLLGRVLPVGRAWRLLIVSLAVAAFLFWIVILAGTELFAQAEALRAIVQDQVVRIADWARAQGLTNASFSPAEITKELAGSLGRLTSAVSSALGALTSIAMIIVIGLFLAIEPRNYERGMAWMLPLDMRDEFYRIMNAMGRTLRRLMAGRLIGMSVEGLATWLLLSLGGVPMAGLLGILTGILAFLPNVGAIISGTLMVLVGFSAGPEAGFWAITVYLVVHLVDGWLIVPTIAKRSVDLAPALVLSAQLLFGALFGIVGLALADPIVAMLKVALERGSEDAAERAALSKRSDREVV